MCFGEHTICVGFPGGSGSKESACNMREGLIPGSRRSPGPEDPRVQKIPWRRVWQPTTVFLPGESHGQKSLVGYSPWGGKESDTTEVTSHAPLTEQDHKVFLALLIASLNNF